MTREEAIVILNTARHSWIGMCCGCGCCCGEQHPKNEDQFILALQTLGIELPL